jgi:hypothetical protein
VRFIVRAKRRRAGIYLARTRRHRGRRRENGYVGRSNNVPIRIKQHLGMDSRHVAKPWADLDPRWFVLRLPWWLSWKWVQVPLEALGIWLLLPRYNHQLNQGNPRRVPLSVQARKRAARDGVRITMRRHFPRPSGYRITGVLFILSAAAMTIWSFVR